MKNFFNKKKEITVKPRIKEDIQEEISQGIVIEINKVDNVLLILAIVSKIEATDKKSNVLLLSNNTTQIQGDVSNITYRNTSYSDDFNRYFDINSVNSNQNLELVYDLCELIVTLKTKINNGEYKSNLADVFNLLKINQAAISSGCKTAIFINTNSEFCLRIISNFNNFIHLKEYIFNNFINENISELFSNNQLSFIPTSVRELPDANSYETMMQYLGLNNIYTANTSCIDEIDNRISDERFIKYKYFIISNEIASYLGTMINDNSQELQIISLGDNYNLMVLDISCQIIQRMIDRALEKSDMNTNAKTTLELISNLYYEHNKKLSELFKVADYLYNNNNSNQIDESTLVGENSFIPNVDEIIE